MVEQLYDIMLIGALIVLSVILFGYLFRSMIGPNFFDRILGVNSISTIVILMICILALLIDQAYVVDIALIYAMLSFVSVVIVCKSYLKSHKKDRYNDFENIQKRGKIDD